MVIWAAAWQPTLPGTRQLPQSTSGSTLGKLFSTPHLLELSIEPLSLRRPLALDALQLDGRLAHLL